MRLVLLVDSGKIALWQKKALERLVGCKIVLVLNCTNTKSKRRIIKYFFYYVLNILAVRNALSRLVDLRSVTDTPLHDFTSFYQGQWQSLPEEVVQLIKEKKADAVIKFGMGLLTIPPSAVLDVPILSYHHGDPEYYRGRPAGFYELLQGAPVLGQMVQVLSNTLDAGQVLAYGESKLCRYSYRKTLLQAFALSPFLLPKAIAALKQKKEIDKPCVGKNYRLPSNLLVFRFVLSLLVRLWKHLGYGAFIEKKWRVSKAELLRDVVDFTDVQQKLCRESVIQHSKDYVFYADPFFFEEGLLVEALSKHSGKGVLVKINDKQHIAITDGKQHLSYPFVVKEQEISWVVPEIASWSQPVCYSVQENHLCHKQELRIKGKPRLMDPSLHVSEEGVFLFANTVEDGMHILHLWVAPSLFEPFILHPQSPICCSPKGGRMAGALLSLGGKLYRLGQNNSGGYGNGIMMFEVMSCTRVDYEERAVGTIQFDTRKGPHTFNLQGQDCCFDWYEERFDLRAGYRRLCARVFS